MLKNILVMSGCILFSCSLVLSRVGVSVDINDLLSHKKDCHALASFPLQFFPLSYINLDEL